MSWKNDITQHLNIEYPIIQAPMFGVTTPEMVAATNATGCLGSLALGDLSADKCSELIKTTRKLTDKPFAANIFVHTIPPLTEELILHYNTMRSFVEKLASDHGLLIKIPDIHTELLTDYRDQVTALIAEKCKIVSFTFGNLDNESIERLKESGIKLIGTCTSVSEALILEKSGIDVICVQGLEAGGHRGSFNQDNIPKIGGLALLPQVCDAVHIPVIYAGGISNAKILNATKSLGAQGFQIGSMLLCTPESNLLDFEKEALKNIKEEDVTLTKAFSGRYAKGINNAFIEALHGIEILPYPYQNKLTATLRNEAKKYKNKDFVSIWTGNGFAHYSNASTTIQLNNLIHDAEEFFNKSE